MGWIRLGRIRLCEEIKGPIYEQLQFKKIVLGANYPLLFVLIVFHFQAWLSLGANSSFNLVLVCRPSNFIIQLIIQLIQLNFVLKVKTHFFQLISDSQSCL
jgi:hypothetical protein